LLQLIPYVSQVVALWTTCVGVISYYNSLFYYALLYSCIYSVSTLYSSGEFLMFSSLLSQGHLIYNLWSLIIYIYKYSLVFLHFTNWYIFTPYFSLCLSCNLSQAKGCNRSVYKLFPSYNQNLYLVGLLSTIADVRLILKDN